MGGSVLNICMYSQMSKLLNSSSQEELCKYSSMRLLSAIKFCNCKLLNNYYIIIQTVKV